MARVIQTLAILFFGLCSTAFAQDNVPVCSAEIAFTNPKAIINPTEVQILNIFSAVNPSSCLSAEIHISASFYDTDDDLICSGTVLLTNQGTHLASTNFELRALNPIEFVRQIDARRPAAKRLFCNNLDGTAEVGGTQMASAASMRLRATILPRVGGLATVEARMTFRR